MDLRSYEDIIKSEQSARKYLLGFCYKNHQRFCPRCRARKVYKLSSGRRRCSRCAYTFHDFSRRYINVGQLTSRQWLRLIKLFELEVPPRTMAEQLGVAYATVLKALTTLRRAILHHALDAPHLFAHGLEADGELREGLVFGVVERRGWAFVDLVPGMSPETLAHFKNAFHLKTAMAGSVLYTDRYRDYDALLCCHEVFKHMPGASHRDKGLFIDTRRGFWAFAKERLKRHKGFTARRFPLYLKELEFRYNHQGEDIFSLLAAQACAIVPNHDDGTRAHLSGHTS